PDLLQRLVPRPLADGDHGDHRGHAEDNAQHGQERAHLVREELDDPSAESVEQAHGYFAGNRATRASWTGVARRGGRCPGVEVGLRISSAGGGTSAICWPGRKPWLTTILSLFRA